MAPLNANRRARLSIPVAFALAFMPWVAAAPAGAQPTSLEYAVKANYLYKFAPFVTWPASSFQNAASPFVICTIGDDAFGGLLGDAVRGQKVGGRPIILRNLTGVTSDTNCQILSIGRSAPQGAADIIAAVAGQPVLTVTDRSRGVDGGMIQFVMQGGRVRFQIDEAAAKGNGIGISSKLLGLALNVNRR